MNYWIVREIVCVREREREERCDSLTSIVGPFLAVLPFPIVSPHEGVSAKLAAQIFLLVVVGFHRMN